jgi:DNA mismatch repair protein MutL
MPRIHLLDQKTAELIAAGEVIERPSSVVKELVENAIDSGASAITVEIQNGGIRLIRVTDNGCGIFREDVPRAFLRHATSKVSSPEDLFAIGTLGFRGEALASICAVARVELLTRTPEETLGTRYEISGGKEISLDDAGCPQGTTILVRDLFYNVPARMKFLKKDTTEGNAVAALMDRLALSHPEISMKLIRDGQMKLHTPGDSKLLSAVYGVYGADFGNGLVPVEHSFGNLSVSGYITRPEKSKATRAMEHFFINHRYVKSVTMMAALEEAYKNSLMTGKFPGCVLDLQLPWEMVDVNVHPAKLEVKLSDERMVFEAVYNACKGALASLGNVTQARDASRSYQNRLHYFEIKNQPLEGEQQRMTAREYREAVAKETGGASVQGKTPAARPPRAAVPAERQPVTLEKERETIPREAPRALRDNGSSVLYRSTIPARGYLKPEEKIQPPKEREVSVPVPARAAEPQKEAPAAQPPERTGGQGRMDQTPEPLGELRLVGEAFHTYILAENDRELFLIDKHAAHERLLFEKLKAEQAAGEPSRQVLLSSLRVSLPKDRYDALIQNLDKVSGCGFEVEDFGDGSVLVREIPSILELDQVEDAVLEMAELLLRSHTRLNLDFYDELYHSMACKAAVKGGSFSGVEEQQKLLDRLAADPTIRNCPHGRPVMIAMTKRELERMFGRLV